MTDRGEVPFQAQGISKVFKERNWRGRTHTVQAVSGLDLALEPGEAFGLIGPNGAGKSTTIKMLMGLVRPSAGTMRLNGCPVEDHRARQGVGFLSEHPALYPQLTALEVVSGAARIQGMARGEAQGEAERLLGEMGLAGVARTPLRKFSKGMQQRAAIAHALAGRPDLLVVDEPLTGLDPIWRTRVVERLMAFRDEGGTVLLSSHILADVERLADRIGILHQGQLHAVTTPASLIGRYVQTYVIRTQGRQDPADESFWKEGSDQWSGEVSEEALWPSLDRLRELGHQIVEVRPAGAGLEGAVMRFLEEAGAK
ncbi:MAG: ABC transporter ATP-binding protein [Thiohalorhabdus sp.]|uniref:ABC transporter ATP-binding protein n=1 Tax=Thiohalorhabdus sp. TaxID=3094134 RepID=UPI0039808ED0